MEGLTGISLLQAEGTEVYRNSQPYTHALTGLPIDVVLGMKPDLPKPFTLLLQTPEMVMGEISTVHEDRGNAAYWIKTTSLCSESGLLFGAIETIRDVTTEKENENKLKAKSRYHRNLVEIHVDPLITVGENLAVSDLNIAAEEIIGDLRENIIGKPFPMLFKEEHLVEKTCTRILHHSL